jgi:hypothetical protein
MPKGPPSLRDATVLDRQGIRRGSLSAHRILFCHRRCMGLIAAFDATMPNKSHIPAIGSDSAHPGVMSRALHGVDAWFLDIVWAVRSILDREISLFIVVADAATKVVTMVGTQIFVSCVNFLPMYAPLFVAHLVIISWT